MKSVWRGAISFGLINIAVRLYSATEEHEVRFRQVHRADAGRIRYRRVCEECGQEIDYADITRGYEFEDGRIVVLEQEDLDQLPISTDRAIDLLEFVPTGQIDPMYFQRSYYLEPDPAATRPYVLLRDALRRTDRCAVVKITLRQRETLAALRTRGDVLVLHTMMWPDEIRTPDFGFVGNEPMVRSQELRMATTLIENMSGSFEPSEFGDDYREALTQLIEAKALGAELPRKQAAGAEGGEVVDLMTALERSLDRIRGGGPAQEGTQQGGSGQRGTGTGRPRGKRAAPASKGSPGHRADRGDEGAARDDETSSGAAGRSTSGRSTGARRTPGRGKGGGRSA